MALSRRDIIRRSALGAGVIAVGNVGALLNSPTALANGTGRGRDDRGRGRRGAPDAYGPLVADPNGLLDLPEGDRKSVV